MEDAPLEWLPVYLQCKTLLNKMAWNIVLSHMTINKGKSLGLSFLSFAQNVGFCVYCEKLDSLSQDVPTLRLSWLTASRRGRLWVARFSSVSSLPPHGVPSPTPPHINSSTTLTTHCLSVSLWLCERNSRIWQRERKLGSLVERREVRMRWRRDGMSEEGC